MKTICVVTGTRAEYGILRPVMRAIQKSAKLGLQVAVTGTHLDLDERFGFTVLEIEKDGIEIDAKVRVLACDDSMKEMGRVVARGIDEFLDRFEELAPDVVLVLGDRTEIFAAAIATVFSGRCLAHVHGGDRSRGGFDESMRHAITKLAHVHFAATEESMERIIRMGEREENVFLVGAPGLDELLTETPASDQDVVDYVGTPLDPAPVVVIQHPVSTRPEDAAGEMREVLEAVIAEGRPVLAIMPNNDAGSARSVEVIREYANKGYVHWVANLPRSLYLRLMACAAVLVGNSSSGIIEAPSFGLPVVNVGERQEGRERAANVIDVAPDRTAIKVAVRKCLYDKDFRQSLKGIENPWGDGHASERIVEILEELEINHDLLQKQIAY